MNEILDLNNSAVIYLQMGRIPDAHALLSQALRLVPRQIVLSTAVASSMASADDDDDDDSSTASLSVEYQFSWVHLGDAAVCPQKMKRRQKRTEGDPQPNHHDSTSYFFPYALDLSKKCSHDNFETQCSCGHYGSCPRSVLWVLWYNLGLTWQLWSKEQRASPTTATLPSIAAGLADLSREIFAKILESCDSVGGLLTGTSELDRECRTLVLATLNNQGCLLYDNARYSEVSSCFRRVQQLLLVVNCLEKDKAHWAFFHLNSLAMLQTHAAGAA